MQRRRSSLLRAVVCCSVAASAVGVISPPAGADTPAGTVSTFTGSAITVPSSIAAGADGALWFTNQSGRTIGRITTAGVSTEYTAPGGLDPDGIAAGSDGNMWFTNGSSIGRITPSGTITKFTAPGINQARAITSGPDGALWFTEDNSIGRISTTGTISTFPVAASPLRGITSGPDGALWFTAPGGDGSIGRITALGSITMFTGQGIVNPRGIAAGPDGALWFTNNGDVGRITTAGSVSIIAATGANWAITAGPDGALWYTDSFNSRVGRVTVAGAVSLFTVPGQNPEGNNRGIASGPDDAVWYVNWGNSSVGRIQASGPPSAPRGSTATPAGGSARVSWFPPSTDGGSTVTAYTVTASPGGAHCTWSSGPHTCSVTGLTNGVAYTFRVTATNAHGTGPASAPSNIVTPTATPGVITGIVTDFDTRTPLGGIIVTLMHDVPNWTIAGTTTTDSSGVYQLDVPPGTYRVRFYDPTGSHPRTWWNDQPTYRASSPRPVDTGQTVNADEVLRADAGELTGRVVQGDSLATATPVEGVSVRVFDANDGYAAGSTTGPSGHYRIGGLRPGSYLVLFVDPSGTSSPQWYRLSTTATTATPVTVTTGGTSRANAWVST